MTADMWPFWAQFLALALLRGFLRDEGCYDHFNDLVKLFGLCLQHNISDADISAIISGFIDWVA